MIWGLLSALLLGGPPAGNTAPPPSQPFRLTLRVTEGIPPGTHLSIRVRARYAHWILPEVRPRDGSQISVGEENEVYAKWAPEVATWDLDVPGSGFPVERQAVLTFPARLPPPPSHEHVDGLFLPTFVEAHYPVAVQGKTKDVREVLFGMPRPASTGAWAGCLLFRWQKGKVEGLRVSFRPSCDEAPGGPTFRGPGSVP